MVNCMGSAVSTWTLWPLLLLMLAEDVLGAFNDGGGQSGETRYFDAVTLAGCAGLDVVQEDNSAGCLFDADAEVAHAGQLFGKHGEFMIMRGEESAGAGFGVEIFNRGPGQREAVKGCGAAAHFVEQDQGLIGGRI